MGSKPVVACNFRLWCIHTRFLSNFNILPLHHVQHDFFPCTVYIFQSFQHIQIYHNHISYVPVRLEVRLMAKVKNSKKAQEELVIIETKPVLTGACVPWRQIKFYLVDRRQLSAGLRTLISFKSFCPWKGVSIHSVELLFM